MSAGDLTGDEVEKIRTGVISDPTVKQVAALAAAFGVPPSYLLDRGRDPSVLDEEVLEALADDTAGAILRQSARLPEREKRNSPRDRAADRKPARRRRRRVAPAPAPHQYAPCSSATKAFEVA
jgi:transcriptional regulator with XRE-family HTH domain